MCTRKLAHSISLRLLGSLRSLACTLSPFCVYVPSVFRRRETIDRAHRAHVVRQAELRNTVCKCTQFAGTWTRPNQTHAHTQWKMKNHVSLPLSKRNDGTNETYIAYGCLCLCFDAVKCIWGWSNRWYVLYGAREREPSSSQQPSPSLPYVLILLELAHIAQHSAPIWGGMWKGIFRLWWTMRRMCEMHGESVSNISIFNCTKVKYNKIVIQFNDTVRNGETRLTNFPHPIYLPLSRTLVASLSSPRAFRMNSPPE